MLHIFVTTCINPVLIISRLIIINTRNKSTAHKTNKSFYINFVNKILEPEANNNNKFTVMNDPVFPLFLILPKKKKTGEKYKHGKTKM